MIARVRRGARTKTTDAAAAADTVLRLAVLLQSGIAPAAAWRHLAETGDRAAVAVVARVEAGDSVADAMRAQTGAWGDVAAAWEIAAAVGAPLADTLRGIAAGLRDAHEAADDVRIALAEPAASARLMLTLPLVGLLLGTALGFDTLPILFGTPFGLAALVGGVVLLLGARRWTRVLVQRVQPAPGVPGLVSDLTAIALSGGASVDRARALVAESGHGAEHPATESALALSRSAGIPAVELLRASAAAERQSTRVAGRLRASRLASHLLLPLGVCTLPAFLLLGVAPLMLSVIGTTVVPL